MHSPWPKTPRRRKKEALEASPRSPRARHPPACAPKRRSRRPPWRQAQRKQRALKLFDVVLALPESGDWKPTAFLGAVRLNFELAAYKKVAEMAEKVLAGTPDDARAESCCSLETRSVS
jgi:hypothetical protein